MTSYAVTLAFLVLLVLALKHSPAYGVGLLLLVGFIAAYPGVATVLILVALGFWLASPQKGRRRR
jgi:hypothetical protein